MKKLSLAELRQVHSNTPPNQPQTQTNAFTNNYYPFWNMAVGQRAIIRFLPDLNDNNPRGFLVEKLTHPLTVNGKERKIPCLTMYGEDCPICKISQAYYKAKDEINGKKYWKKKQHLGQALIIEDPLAPDDDGETHVGKVRMIALGFQIYNIIKDSFASDELEGIPYDFTEGYDFIIKKTEQGKYGSYQIGTKFANKQRPLTEAELAIVHENMIDLSTLLPKKQEVEKVQAILDAEMNGEDYADNQSDASNDTPDETDVKPAPRKAAPVASNDDDDDDIDTNEMLAEIRKRKKA